MNIFQWATKITEGNNVTSSVVLPVIGALEMAFSSEDENSLASKFDSDMIKAFQNSIETRCQVFKCNMFKIAAALDPNYKLSWTMDDAKIVSVKAAIKAELEKITPLPAHTETNTLSASPPRKRSRYLGYLNRRPAVQPTQADRYTSQMNKYLAEDIPEEDKDMVDPLLYWKLHQNQYPDLAMLACRYLHVPASSSPRGTGLLHRRESVPTRQS